MKLPTLLTLATSAGAVIICNGKAEYCDRKYSNITFVGAHNSAFVGIGPSDNQLTSVPSQLDQGIRFLTTQTHDWDGVVEMCHTACELLDAGPLQDYLADIKAWLDKNVNEVVTLLITNGDGIDITRFDAVFKAVGLDKYAYTPTQTLSFNTWPTLGSLLSSGKRLVVFMDYHANPQKVPYILDEFASFFETPFDPLAEQLSLCTLDRPAGTTATGRMILANHNRNYEVLGIFLPDLVNAVDTNSIASIRKQADACKGLWGRGPNVVLLDYVVLGEVMDAQTQLNGL